MTKIRIALFGSYYRGYETLKILLEYKKTNNIEIVGVATDNPYKSFVSPQKRIWQYKTTKKEKEMVKILAKRNNIEVYSGKIKTVFFYKKFKKWNPHICYMGTFGQLLNKKIFTYPKMGFYNLHPCSGEKWPSYIGGNPFKEMIADKKGHTAIVLHKVNEKFDSGKFVDQTKKIKIPKNTTIPTMHKLTSPYAAKLVIKHLKRLINLTPQI
jgi:methionyl-tRNA formyltransferase